MHKNKIIIYAINRNKKCPNYKGRSKMVSAYG